MLKAVLSPAEGFEHILWLEATLPAATAETFEPLEPRLSLGVDLAAIESLALVVLAHDLVSRIQLGKARGRSRIVLVGVRMQLLRLPAEGALDLGGTRRLRYPEDLIGVTHPQPLPLRSPSIVPGIVPISQRFNVVGVAADRNITAGGLRVAPGP